MSWKNSADFDKYKRRRSQRRSLQGRQFESETMLTVLLWMQKRGTIDSFVQHLPRSAADHAGADCTVTRQGESRSFGVTISQQSWVRSRALHPDKKQFWFPPEMKWETIEKRILELFAATDNPVVVA